MTAADHDAFPAPDDWARLTVVPEKRTAFEVELYFREGWADAAATFGPDTLDVLHRMALFSMKPDGLAARRSDRVLDYLGEHGFAVVGWTTVRQTRLSMRELWRYNWHVYPVDRLELSTLMHSAADTPVLLLHDTLQDAIPGSVRLSDLKGSANPADRRPEQLRAVLEPPNKVVNFVHVADEPVDLPRELAIFLAGPERRALLATARQNLALGADLREQAREMLRALEAATPPSDFDLAGALERWRAAGAVAPEGVQRVERALASGEPISWEELLTIADPHDPDVDLWDFVRIGSEVLVAERRGYGNLLPDPTTQAWAER